MSNCDSERVIKIVNAVRQQECLWNVHSQEYGKRDKLEKAWNEVAQEVGKSDVFCREKWRNVRTGFLRSIQHQIRGSSNQEDSNEGFKRKRFYLHDQMAFLLPSAEALESARKKRKLNKERSKSLIETDDTDTSNTFTEYNLIRKDEPLEVEIEENDGENEGEELEHHTLMINGEVYSDNDDDEEILKVLDHNINTTKQKENPSSKDNHQQSSSKYKDDYVMELLTTNSNPSPTTRKVIRMINEKMNDNEFDSKPDKSISEPIMKHASQFSQREEQQLLDFFRGCIDDILTLSKRKQRLFKKRMLNVIDELYDS